MAAPLSRPAHSSTPRRPIPTPGTQRAGTPAAADTARPQRADTVNPLRIRRIGTDGIQVFIRPVSSDAEFAALIDRMNQLLAAGFETIDVVFEDAPDQDAGTRISTTEPAAA